jgi:hypothetical protein
MSGACKSLDGIKPYADGVRIEAFFGKAVAEGTRTRGVL